MTHVFVSYVRDDEALVQALCSALREHGVVLWLDRERIQPGIRWRAAIRTAIQNGAYFLACFSKGYAGRARTYMNEELTLAIDQLRQTPTSRAWFVPVTFGEDCVPDRDIGAGETLRDIQWIDMGSNPYTESWRIGVHRLRTVLQLKYEEHHRQGLAADIREPIISRSEEALRSILRGTARQTIDAALDEFVADKDQQRYDYLLRPVCEVFGNQFSVEQVVRMVTRNQTGNSRTGFHGLCVLYEKHFEHMKSLKLLEAFKGNFQIGYFVQLRERYPPEKDLFHIAVHGNKADFTIGEAQFDSEYFLDKFMNRGESAFLDAIFLKQPDA